MLVFFSVTLPTLVLLHARTVMERGFLNQLSATERKQVDPPFLVSIIHISASSSTTMTTLLMGDGWSRRMLTAMMRMLLSGTVGMALMMRSVQRRRLLGGN